MPRPFLGRLESYPIAGRPHVTVIVKASCRIRDERTCEPFDAEPWIDQDVYRGPRLRGSLLRARENAPYLPRCDVFLAGRIHAPPGGDPRRVAVGLFIGRGARVLLTKYAEATSTAAHPDVTGMPLLHEYAYAGATSQNPAGAPTLAAASIRLIDRPDEPALFGPLSPSWPARTARAEAAPGTHTSAFDDPLAWAHLNAAPQDQQVRRLYGDELVCVWGLDPGRERLSFTLPGLTPIAHLVHPAWASPHELPLCLDTVAIDVEGGCLNLLWRGATAVPDPIIPVRAEVTMTALPSVEPAPAATTHFDRVQIVSAHDRDTCPHAETLEALPPVDARAPVLPFAPPIPGERPCLPPLEPPTEPCEPSGATELLDARLHRDRIDEGRRMALPFPTAPRRDRPAARTVSLGAAFMDLVHGSELAPLAVKKGDR